MPIRMTKIDKRNDRSCGQGFRTRGYLLIDGRVELDRATKEINVEIP